jgi:hypothetical protein
MKRSLRPASGQFTLALQREARPPLNEPRTEELLKVLAELLLEALGVESAENQAEQESSDEPQDHA